MAYNASQKGWFFDRLADLARVLRIPGTINGKDANHQKHVDLVSCTDRRYSPESFEAYLDLQLIPRPEKSERKARELNIDEPFDIDLAANMPEDLLTRWFEEDQRFRETWFRQRLDLKDQSQSGYDIALARFGADHKLSDQQIVDLLVTHRRTHKQKQITRSDYFQRTISKVRNGTDYIEDLAPTVLESAPIDPSEAADPAIARARACDRLSQILGISVLRIIKITGHDPVYRLDLDQGTIEIPDIGKLMSQTHMRHRIAAATGRFISPLPGKKWCDVAQLLLDACTEEEGGEDMDLQGAARLHVRRYLAAVAPITSIEGQVDDSARRPILDDGKIAVSASDLLQFLNKTVSPTFTIPRVTGFLSCIGATSKRIRGNFPEQSRWLLPTSEFDPDEYRRRHEGETSDA